MVKGSYRGSCGPIGTLLILLGLVGYRTSSGTGAEASAETELPLVRAGVLGCMVVVPGVLGFGLGDVLVSSLGVYARELQGSVRRKTQRR